MTHLEKLESELKAFEQKKTTAYEQYHQLIGATTVLQQLIDLIKNESCPNENSETEDQDENLTV